MRNNLIFKEKAKRSEVKLKNKKYSNWPEIISNLSRLNISLKEEFDIALQRSCLKISYIGNE